MIQEITVSDEDSDWEHFDISHNVAELESEQVVVNDLHLPLQDCSSNTP